MAKPALGRGLGALLGGSAAAAKPALAPVAAATTVAPIAGERVERVPLSRVQPCSFQPRKQFAEEALRELADSIKEKGILQPLIVRERNGAYELIAGERRWRASQLIGLAEVPVIVRVADDQTVLELALIENLQRENLNPMEEAVGYFQLMEQFRLTQEDVGVKVGKSRAVIANALRLLRLAEFIQNAIRTGDFSVGHAKVILGLEDAAQQKLAADKILQQKLSVRQTEMLVAQLREGKTKSSAVKHAALTGDVHVQQMEDKLREKFGAKVRLKYREGKGSLEIAFFNDEDLERILQIIGVSAD